ncbi:hypothetical protein D9M68_636100 [compost metagenome]
MADAALGRGGRAQEGRVVVVVDQQAQPGAEVADLGAVEEALAARDLVGNLRAAQRLFERTRHVVGAVEDGEVAPFLVLRARAQALDARDRALGLVVLVVGIDHAHRFAFAQVAPQRLGKQLGVGADHVVGRAKNGAGGAVVLLQLDDLERRVVDRQLLQVVQRGAAPAVDRLVVVAHRRELAALAGQRLEHFVLRGVGVLVFVDQDVAQHGLPLRAHLGELVQQLQRHADEVVEVHALVGLQPLFVLDHDLGRDALVVVHRGGRGLRSVQAHVLPLADRPLPDAGGGNVDGAAAVFQDLGDVVAVQDAEGFLQAQHVAVFPHHAHAQRVEGTHHHLARVAPDQVLGALAHFGRRLVREGDGRDALGLQARLDQPADLVRDHARLARARACEHQTGTVHVVDRFLLGEIETVGHGGRGNRESRRAEKRKSGKAERGRRARPSQSGQ